MTDETLEAEQRKAIEILDKHVDHVRHYLHLQIGKPASPRLVSAPEIALDTLHRELKAALFRPVTAGADQADDTDDKMWKISKLIADLQSTQERFGDTCVYVRRGGLSWGAVALNRRADDEKHGVFDLQAQHDRDMLERLEQIERLKNDRNEWRQKVWDAETAARSPAAVLALSPQDGVVQWRHKKRGSVVTEVARGFAQVAAHPIEEMTAVVIYKHDGHWWVRNAVEFDDGRFEAYPLPRADGSVP